MLPAIQLWLLASGILELHPSTPNIPVFLAGYFKLLQEVKEDVGVHINRKPCKTSQTSAPWDDLGWKGAQVSSGLTFSALTSPGLLKS